MLEKLKSRKFWIAVLGAALLAAGEQLGVPKETTQQIVVLLAAYLLGQSLVDARRG